MDRDKITSLLDQASERYNSAGYREAIDLWNQVLALDPGNQKAREGIRMASLLVAESRPESPSAPKATGPGEDQVKARIEAGLRRVRELVDSGQKDAALRGCELLKQLAPESAEVKALVAEVEGEATPEPALDEMLDEPIPLEDPDDIEAILVEARQALAEGRNRDATQAASRVLQIDPSHMEACGILSRAADDDMQGEPLSIENEVDTGEVPAVGFEEGSLSLDDAEPDPQPEGTPPPPEEAAGVAPSADAAPDDRVSQLLTEGRAAFDDGRVQDAIEIWSRVFVLDQSNSEAGLLIDKAKGLLEEKAREIDDLFYKGIDLQDAGDLESALELFLKVRSLSPTHPEAGLRIEEINARLSGDAPAIGLDMERAREIEQLQQEQSEPEQLFNGGTVPLASTQEFPSVEKPARSEPRPPATRMETPPGREGGSGRLLKIAAGVLVFAGAGVGAWLWFGSDTGSMQEAEATVAVTPRPRPADASIEPPGENTVAGKPAPAATSPDESLTVLQGAVSPAPVRPPATEGVYADRAKAADLVREGRELYQQEQWAASIRALRSAAELDPMGFDAQDTLDKAMASLEREAHLEREMEVSKRYFSEGDYASALHKFYRIQIDYPEIREMSRYIRNAWFNWGVMLLQAGAVEEAAEKFAEVLDISPRDQEAARAREVAMRYRGKTRDSFYDSFSTALALRSLDQN